MAQQEKKTAEKSADVDQGVGKPEPQAEVPAEELEQVEAETEPAPDEGTEGLPPEKQDPKITAASVTVRGAKVSVEVGEDEDY